MKYSIVTVTYNCEKLIQKTIDSVARQTHRELEHIIIDGCSTDATCTLISNAAEADSRMVFLSEPDTGIYNAMNKALKYLSGDYVIFLNAGDYFFSDETLEHIQKFICDMEYPDVINGNVIVYTSRGIKKIERKKFGKRLFLIANTVCHQGVFAKATLFNEYIFDETFKYCADRDWLYYMFVKRKYFAYIDEDIAFYEGTGFSSAPDAKREIIEERYKLQKKYCKKYFYIHKIIRIFLPKRYSMS